MKKFMIVGMLALLFTIGCAPVEDTSDSKMTEQTELAMKEMNAQIGMPAIKNFQERKLAKMIFELRDQVDLITYAYIVSLEGKLIFVGKCIGFGLPYSVQYTNPQKMVNRYGQPITSTGWDPFILPQADPNGLFMPTGLSATWLMMIDKNGKPNPVYFEPEIVVSPFPLH